MSFKAYTVSLTKNKIELEEAFDKLKKAEETTEAWYFVGLVKDFEGERFALFTIDRHIEDVYKVFPNCEQRAVSKEDIDTKRFIPIEVEDRIWELSEWY